MSYFSTNQLYPTFFQHYLSHKNPEGKIQSQNKNKSYSCLLEKGLWASPVKIVTTLFHKISDYTAILNYVIRSIKQLGRTEEWCSYYSTWKNNKIINFIEHNLILMKSMQWRNYSGKYSRILQCSSLGDNRVMLF